MRRGWSECTGHAQCRFRGERNDSNDQFHSLDARDPVFVDYRVSETGRLQGKRQNPNTAYPKAYKHTSTCARYLNHHAALPSQRVLPPHVKKRSLARFLRNARRHVQVLADSARLA
jgi:hypothetical protein